MYAEIIIALSLKALDKPFYYRLPAGLVPRAAVGKRVFVPFGKGDKMNEGYIVGLTEQPDCDVSIIKDIRVIPDEYPLFDENMLTLAKWMQDKYFATLADCLRCIIPVGVQIKRPSLPSKVEKFAALSEEPEAQRLLEELLESPKNSQGKQVAELLLKEERLAVSDIKALLKISDSPINTLAKKGIVTIEELELIRNTVSDDIEQLQDEVTLTSLQDDALNQIITQMQSPEKKPILIHGVTGSGKTEIYSRLIKGAIAQGKEAIVLVPEISLTPQTVKYFVERFGSDVSVTHSRLTACERFDQWKKAREKKIKIMVGPRSAIFMPFSNLGIIIVDEEHERTYKSENSPKYSVKEVALKLSELTGAQVVFGSATPSVESFFEAESGLMSLVTISERINGTPPEVTIVDMRRELALGNKSIFSQGLITAMEESLNKNEQTILFLNRRGHSTFVSCRKCGYTCACDNCNVNYTYHKFNEKLVCHYCGKSTDTPTNCPICGSKYIRYFGIGTQRVENEIQEIFKDTKVLRMDMDTTARKHSHEKILNSFKNNEVQILIGTQMITKGLDFPNVTVVGVIAADLSLNTGDFRSAETTFQLITQVAGRAGRAAALGRVFIQTYSPEHYSIQYARDNDYLRFYQEEIVLRRQMQYPPYTNVFTVLFTGEDEKKIITNLFKLLELMNHFNKKGLFEMIGPAPCIISKIKRKYRWKLIIKGVEEERLKNFVLYCIDKLEKVADNSNISINLTMNPILIV